MNSRRAVAVSDATRVAVKDIDTRRAHKLPWVKRAMDRRTGMLGGNQTVQTASMEHKGKEVLFPTIRMVGGKLKRIDSMEKALRIALAKGDTLEFDTPAEATAFSKALSREIGRRRNRR